MEQKHFAELLPAAFLRSCAVQGVEVQSTIANAMKVLRLNPEKCAQMARTWLGADRVPTFSEVEEVVASINNSSITVSPFSRAFYCQFKAAGFRPNILDSTTLEMYAQAERHWQARWASVGLPTFSLTHSLTAALLLTEPPKYDPETFHLPFPAFAMVVPPEFIPVYHGEQRCWGEVVRVHQFEGYSEGSRRTLIYIDVTERGSRRLVKIQPIEKFVSEEAILDLAGVTDLPPEDEEEDKRSLRLAIHLVRNLAAWLTSHSTGTPEGKPRAKGDKYHRDREGNPIPTMWILGREVKLAPELRRVATDVALHQRKGVGWKLMQQHCVMGHFWPKDPNRIPKKGHRRWVAPYWRGPEGAAAWAHVYTDGENK